MKDQGQRSCEGEQTATNTPISRRKALQATAGALAIGNISGVVLGQEDGPSKEHFEKAREIRRETGSHEQYVDYLRQHGFEVTERQSQIQYIDGSSGGVKQTGISPQEIQETDMTGTLTMIDPAIFSDVAVEYRVDVQSGSWVGPGQAPEDHVTISWPSSDYDLIEDGAYKSNASSATLKKSTFNGADWSWSDGATCGHGCNLYFIVGVSLNRLTPDSPPRKVEGRYQSVWGDNSTSLNVSIALDGSLSFTESGSGDIDYEQINREVISE